MLCVGEYHLIVEIDTTPPLYSIQTILRMDSSLGLTEKNESPAIQPPSEGEPVTSSNGDGRTTDEGEDIGPPLTKKAKIENGATDTSIATSNGEPSSPRDRDASPSDDDEDHGENNEHLDEEEIDYEEEEANSDDEELFQQILALARAGRIPVEYLAARGIHVEFDDDEPVEYPFDQPPKSIDDVADFIQSEKCQRIMVLAG